MMSFLARSGLRPISGLWVSSMLAAGFGFVLQVVLARELGPSNYGVFSAALAVVTIMVPVAGFGTHSLWLKVFGQEGWAAHRWLLPSFKFIGVTTASAVVCIGVWAFVGPHDDETRSILLLLLPMIVASVLASIVTATLQLEGRYSVLSIWQLTPSLIRLSLLGIVLVFFSLSAYSAALLYLSAGILVITAALTPLRRITIDGIALVGHTRSAHGQDHGRYPPVSHGDFMKAAWPFGVAGLLYPIYYQSDVILVRYLSSPEEAGIYNVAFVVMTAIYLLPSTVYQKYLMPKLHRWATYDYNRFLEGYRLGNGNMLVLGVVIAGILFLIGPLIVPIMFGGDYARTGNVLMILALAVPVRFLATSVGAVLSTGSHMAKKVRYMALTAGFNVVANIVLIPAYGAAGAASATVASEVLLLILYLSAVKRYVFGSEALRYWRVGFGGKRSN